MSKIKQDTVRISGTVNGEPVEQDMICGELNIEISAVRIYHPAHCDFAPNKAIFNSKVREL